jgi:hypothetical protein
MKNQFVQTFGGFVNNWLATDPQGRTHSAGRHISTEKKRFAHANPLLSVAGFGSTNQKSIKKPKRFIC